MNETIKIRMENLSFRYGNATVLSGVDAAFGENRISAVTGPSGSGKSTLLTLFNRLWEETPGATLSGRVMIRLDGTLQEIYSKGAPTAPALRRKVGMVFQAPNPLPADIFANVAFPLKLSGVRGGDQVREKVEAALKDAWLWEEVKHRLNHSALALSGGQQQRLCIARALVMAPEVLLLDEPTSSLDPESESVIEALLETLKSRCTIILVSHRTRQVERIADDVFELQSTMLRKAAGGPAMTHVFKSYSASGN